LPSQATAPNEQWSATGRTKNIVALRLELAAGCPKIAANRIMDLCGVYYPTGSDDDRAGLQAVP